MDNLKEILKKYWGHENFRPLQEEIIQSILSGKDTIGLLPTGGGKSITFQVPTLATNGLCLVITPLIALMKDQVDSLKEKQIKAAYLHAGMTRAKIVTTIDNCIYGHYKFLYVSPERLTTEIFLAKLPYLDVSLVAVDEAHCISQWGYDFRPAYVKIADIRHYIPKTPFLALTATATPEVIKDIERQLLLKNPNIFRKSFKRENISYVVRDDEEKLQQIVRIVTAIKGSTIIYSRNRENTSIIASHLKHYGFNATFFHAGLIQDEKIKRQNAWKADQCSIIVCTNAFGMGIDKPDVRLVIHYELPSTLEEYMQESGRAGRDGLKSYAVALYDKKHDGRSLKRRISDTFPSKDFIKTVYEKLAYLFQLPVGNGENSTYNFNLEKFCSVHNYNTLRTFNAIKILEMSGYIEYSEESDRQSRIMILCTKEDLYNYNDMTQTSETVLITLLRSYSGLFSDYAFIDEEIIAHRSKLHVLTVTETLKMLSKQNILHYIPAKHTPTIHYTQDRIDAERIKIPQTVYEQRKNNLTTRINKILEYGQNQTACRSRIILEYFGEKNIQDCGKCDICIEKSKLNGNNNKEKEKFAQIILNLLKSNKRTVQEIIENSPLTEKQITGTLRFLQDSRQIKMENNYIEKI